MSTFREIWIKAILANQELALNYTKGELAFKRLLEANPQDGMVYYERGEAYEYLHKFELAESDYETAERLFPAPHWKVVAHEGVVRVQLKKQSSQAVTRAHSLQWEIFHRVHGVPQIPHEIRVDALSAISRFDSEPHAAAAQLRSCLEQLVIVLLERLHINYSDARTLEKQIALLDSLELIPSSIAVQMDRLRDLGNKGSHVEKRKRPIDFTPSMPAFAEIVEWVGSTIFSFNKINA